MSDFLCNSSLLDKLAKSKKRKKKCNKPFININADKQTLCYNVLCDSIVRNFKLSDKIIDFHEFKLIRFPSVIYENSFKILIHWNNNPSFEFGEIYYTRRTDHNKPIKQVWIKIENRCLYSKFNDLDDSINSNISIFADYICAILGLELNNIKDLDICLDTSTNVCKKIYSLIRNENFDTILNGRVVTNRKQFIDDIVYHSTGSLNRILNTNITVAQKDIRNGAYKTRIYNKWNEIKNKDYYKEYILEWYKLTGKKLYRIETELHNKQMKKYLKDRDIILTHSLLLDRNFLFDCLLYHCNRVIRFRQGKKVISALEAALM